MRSLEPMPGNPWPHDMVLRIANDDQGLLDLLWVRAAWALEPAGDVPPDPEIPPEPATTVQSLRRDKWEWESGWTELWSAVLHHAGRRHDPGEFEALTAAPLGSEERRRRLEAMTGPSWRDRFGDDAFDERYDRWLEAVSRDGMAEHRLPLEQHPERRSLQPLIGAWQRGLETIVTIPCVGDYTRTISETGLCVTRAVRFDPDRYDRALQAFQR